MNVLSLFSGCGGMDIGFEGGFTCLKRSINIKVHPDWITEESGNTVRVAETGFHTVFANDISPDAKTAWVSYFSNRMKNAKEIYHIDSIVDLVKRAKDGEKVFPDNIDVVTGGFPCQDFSISGKRKGFNSEKSHNGGKLEVGEPSVESRGQLYMWMRDVVTLTEPALFIAENVKGLTNLDDVKEVIEKDFSNAANGGYLVVPARVLHAADYGVPQSRERVIFFGFKKSALKKNALTALRKKDIPVTYDPYHRSQLKEGESLWWTGDSSDETVSATIKLWKNVSPEDKRKYTIFGCVNYPEVFGGNYDRYALWLTSQGIVAPHIRDQFSAGGQEEMLLSNGKKVKFPGVYRRIKNSPELFFGRMAQNDPMELSGSKTLGIEALNRRLMIWADLVSRKSTIDYGVSMDALKTYFWGIGGSNFPWWKDKI